MRMRCINKHKHLLVPQSLSWNDRNFPSQSENVARNTLVAHTEQEYHKKNYQ